MCDNQDNRYTALFIFIWLKAYHTYISDESEDCITWGLGNATEWKITLELR